MTSTPPEERLIVALNQATEAERLALVDELDDLVAFYKINHLWLFQRGLSGILQELTARRGKKVFLDLKFFDTHDTIGSYIGPVAEAGVDFATVHGIERAVVEARNAVDRVRGSPLKILAVTFLTSLRQEDLHDLYGVTDSVEEYMLERTRALLEAGCDGVIASPKEVAYIRDGVAELRPDALIVTPGVREQQEASNDHARSATPRAAIGGGADYIVVGRPIITAANPRVTATAYLAGIREGLSDRGVLSK